MIRFQNQNTWGMENLIHFKKIFSQERRQISHKYGMEREKCQEVNKKLRLVL